MNAREKAKKLLERTDLPQRDRLDRVLNYSFITSDAVHNIEHNIERQQAAIEPKTLFCQLCGQHRLPGENDMDPDDCGGISMCDPCRADTKSQIEQGRKSAECQFCEDRLLREFFEEQQAAEYGMCKACQERLEKLDLLAECDGCHGFVHQEQTSSVCTFPGSRYQPPEHADICERCSDRANDAAEDKADMLRDEGVRW